MMFSPRFVHDLYRLADALADEFSRALRARYPSQDAYLEARYARPLPPDIEAIHQRAVAVHEAWKHASEGDHA